ncbi:MAG: hypothetical protein U9Q83_06675, partial [Bacteroidota bacterium]|nr:hypothetical protein [Bacteroidota bacterium]
MKKHILIFSILLSALSLCAQVENFGNEKQKVLETYTFAVRIIPNNYGVSTFYILKNNPDSSFIVYRTISQKSFILLALGEEKSIANRKTENYFVKYNVFDSVKIMRKIIASIYPIPSDQQYYKYQKKERFDNQIKYLAEKNVENF